MAFEEFIKYVKGILLDQKIVRGHPRKGFLMGNLTLLP